MVLIEGGLLKVFIWSVKAMSVFQCMPMKWNAEKSRFILITVRDRKIQQIRLLGAFIYLVLALTQIIYFWEESSRYVSTHGVMGTAGYTMSIVSTYVNCQRPKEVVAIINDLIEYEERSYRSTLNNVGKKGKRTTGELEPGNWLTKQLMQTQTLSAFASISYHLGVFNFPCYPMVVGSTIIGQCKNEVVTNWQLELGKRLGVTLWSFSNWAFVLPGCILHVVLMMMQGHCFKTYINRYEGEVCNPDKKISEIPWHHYREIQVILTKHRVLNSGYLLNAVLVSQMGCQITTLYNSLDILRAGDDKSIDVGMTLVFFWSAIFCGLTIVMFYGKLGQVHSASQGALENINGMSTLKRNKWCRRYFNSCPVLKIYLSYTNYVDSEMPLSAEEIVVDQTTSLLLLE